MFWVRDIKLKLDQSDVSKVNMSDTKKVTRQFLFLQIKAHYKVPKNTIKLSGFDDNYIYI